MSFSPQNQGIKTADPIRADSADLQVKRNLDKLRKAIGSRGDKFRLLQVDSCKNAWTRCRALQVGHNKKV